VLTETADGLYCAAGDFFIDPWQPVTRALITHAHGDHARPGSRAYLGTPGTAALLRRRLGADAMIETIDYGARLRLGDVTVSFHPAGHVLGSAQIRIEGADGVWVVSGDYKRAADPTCVPFEPVPCDTFITESTFGLPIYRWDDTAIVMRDIMT
jgi:putative mRNA 3-end processing factor